MSVEVSDLGLEISETQLHVKSIGVEVTASKTSIKGIALECETVAEGIEFGPYDSSSSIFSKAVQQALISDSPYDESPGQVNEINAALSKTPSDYDEKPIVVRAWAA